MNNKKFFIIIPVILIYIFISRNSIFASNINETSPETLAVTLVIDTSGSMATTDPQKLRETAANIFIDLLSPEDYLSIITFNTKEEIVLPMQQIQSTENKANFKKMLSQKLNATGDTDYLLALNEASKQLGSVNKGNLRKVVLFLTDGEPDPNSTRKNDAAFMNTYMDSLWNAVSNLALNKYAVYSVGFSKGINPAILERISNSTQGALKISDDSSELALSFFDILGNLKNRKNFLNKTFELKGSDNHEFDLDEYTSQATMVFTNSQGTPFDVTVSAPEGKDVKDAITVIKSGKYNIVTVNGKNEKLAGKWKVNLKGDGRIRAFGNTDPFVKSWLISPEAGSLHPLNDPLEISVNITGEVRENISIEAVITKEGIIDETPVKLTIKDGVFKGTYNKVDKLGKYDIETRLMYKGETISKNNVSFTVRELPSISTSFLESDTNFEVGENILVTSSLNIAGSRLIDNNELKIENYDLLLNYSNSGTQTIPLLDNGSADNEDSKSNDGIWSNKILFNKEDSGNALLRANGTYKGEKFLLEKPLSNFKIDMPGKVLAKTVDNGLYISIAKYLGILGVILLFIILLGLLLFKKLVQSSTVVQGKLCYWKESDQEAVDKKELDFSKLSEDKIIITFNDENKNAQYHILNPKYNYDIELIAITQRSRCKFIDGYKALFDRTISMQLLLKTTVPGIFIYKGKVFTSKEIYKNDSFTTGGYVFEYILDDNNKSVNNKGKNVLKNDRDINL
jgi:Mg-chelatase subunit ChlD